MTSASDALEWMKRKAEVQGDNVLFRGQNREWPTVKPSISRLDDQTMKEMWTICRRFQSCASGVTGYRIPNEHDRLAILQHYIGWSPIIDLTGTPEVAMYFALQGVESNRECVVYSIDQSVADSPSVVFSDHAFLALPLDSGGLKHRWLRQDGYSVGPTEWRELDVVRNFDFLKLPGVETRRFEAGPEDRHIIQHLGDLEDIGSDQLALAVRGTINAIARGLDVQTDGIAEVLKSSKTRDPDAELAAEIDGLIEVASNANLPTDLLRSLSSLRAAVGINWDTSFDASLEVVRRQVLSRAPD